jgi:hypothetical protein
MWMFKLLVLGLATYGGVKLVRSALAARDAARAEESFDDASITEAELVIVTVDPGPGMSDVDPVGLAGMGEGIDLDANQAASSEIREQREKLPGRDR